MGEVVRPEDLGTHLREIYRRIHTLETAPRATHTSVQNGSFRILDDAGNELVRLAGDGITIIDGAITVDGGPVRAIDLDFSESQNQDVGLSGSSVESGIVTVTPPAWAATVVVQTYSIVQMRNNTAAPQAIQLRAMVQGVPSSGLWTDDVGPAEWGIAFDFFQRTLERGVDFSSTVNASTQVAVSVGLNAQNWVRTKATLFYLR